MKGLRRRTGAEGRVRRLGTVQAHCHAEITSVAAPGCHVSYRQCRQLRDRAIRQVGSALIGRYRAAGANCAPPVLCLPEGGDEFRAALHQFAGVLIGGDAAELARQRLRPSLQAVRSSLVVFDAWLASPHGWTLPACSTLRNPDLISRPGCASAREGCHFRIKITCEIKTVIVLGFLLRSPCAPGQVAPL